jgi:hypothetical protein
LRLPRYVLRVFVFAVNNQKKAVVLIIRFLFQAAIEKYKSERLLNQNMSAAGGRAFPYVTL